MTSTYQSDENDHNLQQNQIKYSSSHQIILSQHLQGTAKETRGTKNTMKKMEKHIISVATSTCHLLSQAKEKEKIKHPKEG